MDKYNTEKLKALAIHAGEDLQAAINYRDVDLAERALIMIDIINQMLKTE